MYSLDYSVKSFAVANEFVTTLNKVCYKLGTQLKPFCLCADEFQKEMGVIDLALFGGFVNKNQTLLDEIASIRREELAKNGVYVTGTDYETKKTLLYQYLMTVSICYVEYEKYKTVNGITQPTYDKFLCTRNPSIMGAWMGLQATDMQSKYSPRLKADVYELNNNVVRYVKLQQSAKGNSITQPRAYLDTKKMKCVPMFMLYAWMEGCKTVLSENIVKFTFLKDNHTKREMCSTLSEDIIRRYYSDNAFISTMLSGVDVNTTEQGGMMLPSKMNRGYVKVPELGSSVYDSTGTRSLNLARILSAEITDYVDTTYINVSLDSVVPNFQKCLELCVVNTPNLLKDISKKFMPDVEIDEEETAVVTCERLVRWASEQELLLSTQFKRLLHRMILENPSWFPTYKGGKTEEKPVMQDFGVAPMDF